MSILEKTDKWISPSDLQSHIYVDQYCPTIVSVSNDNIFFTKNIIYRPHIECKHQIFLLLVISPFIFEYQYSNFNKTLSVLNIIRFTRKDKYKFLFVEYVTSSSGTCTPLFVVN